MVIEDLQIFPCVAFSCLFLSDTGIQSTTSMCPLSRNIILGLDSLFCALFPDRHKCSVTLVLNDTDLPETQAPESDGSAEAERCLRNSVSLYRKSVLSRWYEGNDQ